MKIRCSRSSVSEADGDPITFVDFTLELSGLLERVCEGACGPTVPRFECDIEFYNRTEEAVHAASIPPVPAGSSRPDHLA